jgi:hypothetical protein
MSRKVAPVIIALGAVVLLTSRADASPLFRFFEDISVAPSVPEIDFRDLGSVGIGTLVVAFAYVAEKTYRKVVGRKRD